MIRRIKYVAFSLFCLLQVCGVLLGQNNQPRTRYNFNSDWKLFAGDVKEAPAMDFNDAQWKTITLPHAWNEDEAFKNRIDSLSTGIAWYRKHFRLPVSAKGKKIFLEFEGARMGADIYLNGTFIGTHENGVMAFGMDITNLVDFDGVNLIAVRTDNDWLYKEKSTGSRFEWNDRNFNANYGGLPKNVWLHITDKLYQTLPLFSFLKTTGTYIYAKDIHVKSKSATVTVESQIKNEYPVSKTFVFEASVRDHSGQVIKTMASPEITLATGEMKTVRVSSTITGLNFWSWGYGYLYDVLTRIKSDKMIIDEVKTTTGFRKTAFKDGMIYLNDRVIMMHGYAQRTTNEWPALGMSVPAWMSDYSNKLMVQSNGNLVRWMHITPWKQDVESCDRVGLLQAMPAGDAEKDVTGRWWDQRLELMRDAIIYNRNNPSIIFYESGNESISKDHMIQMKAIRDQYDPNGGRAIGSREMLDIAEAEYGGEMLYINKSAAKPVWAMEYARDEAHRMYWDEYTPPYHKNGEGPQYKGASASDYNKNNDSFAIDAVRQWYDYWVARPGTGKRVSSGGTSIMFSESNTFTRSAFNYRTSGKTDAMRIPKDAFFAQKVMWDGWVDPDPGGIHIIGHWNYKDGVKKNVYVIAAGDKVELFINGRSLGFGKKSYHFLNTFEHVAWEPGILKAVSYSSGGKKLSEEQLVTAGEPVAIRMTTFQHPEGLHADGADIAMAEVEVVDAKGNRCPTAANMISFSLGGPAEWRGGIAMGPDNYILSRNLPVIGGVNRVMVRASTKAGKITLTATSPGLKPASADWISIPVSIENGLSTFMPSRGLPVNLDRGPTPDGSPYQVVRQSLPIKSATAGANVDSAFASYDDNELSGWVSDGKSSTAWIRYELERPDVINEIDLKLNNFRRRSYPLIILVDGKVVFNGPTTPGLGYFTASFQPTTGRFVTIKLGNGATINKGVDIGLEVTGKKLDDGIMRDGAMVKGTLSIIEVEIYKTVSPSSLNFKID